MGLVTFVAVAQFAPALLGGLFWAGGRRNGAIGGLSVGLVVWAYTLMLPLLATSGLLSADWLQHGPAGLGFLRPQALFGLGRLDPVSHAAVWSLAANIVAYVGLSLTARPSVVERLQAGVFTTVGAAPTGALRAWSSSAISGDLELLAEIGLSMGQLAVFWEGSNAAITERLREISAEDSENTRTLRKLTLKADPHALD